MDTTLQSSVSALDLVVQEQADRNRLTVAFRYILAIPHFVVLTIFMFLSEIALFFGWFGALFTGHLPAGIHRFLAKALGYFARMQGYTSLLSDRYPRFGFNDPEYPVQFETPASAKLNRLAVLFRIILIIPAYIVMALVSGGSFVIMFSSWLAIIMTGRMPKTLFQATYVMNRYQLRLAAYAGLLTSVYPRGLFGDPEPATPVAAPAGEMLPPAATPEVETFGVVTAPEIPAEPSPAEPVAIRSMTLGKNAKILLVVSMVVGVAAQGISFSLSFNSSKYIARANVVAAYNTFAETTVPLTKDMQTCSSLDCAQTAERTLAADVRAFVRKIEALDLPPRAKEQKDALEAAGNKFASVFDALAGAATPAEYQSLAIELKPEEVGTAFDEAVNRLLDALR